MYLETGEQERSLRNWKQYLRQVNESTLPKKHA